MNLDDESLLTAYLDGELDIGQRQRVEAALRTNPRLAQRLRDLERVREAIGSLSRPSVPADLAKSVLLGIQEAEALRQRRRESRRLAKRRLVALAPLSAVAAVLLVLWSLHGLSGQQEALGPNPVQHAKASNQDRPATAPVPDVEVARVEAPSGPSKPAEVADTERSSVKVAAMAKPDLVREAARRADQERLRQLLGSMEVQRFLVEVDALDAGNLRRIEETITATPRSNARHARFHVLQGLALDPEHPGEAIVYAMVLDDFELKNFREGLRREFPEADLVSRPVRPELVARLTETESLEIVEGRPSGSLVEHEGERPGPVAIRSTEPGSPGRVADMPPFPDPNHNQVASGHRVADSRHRRSRAPREDGAPHPRDEPESSDRVELCHKPLVYLVWVEKRAETSPGR